MNKLLIKAIDKINYINAEIGALYHRASLKLGMTDSASIVLYAAYQGGGSCLLSDIYKMSGVSKQTVNTGLRALEKTGIIRVEPYRGKLKKVIITPAGMEYSKHTVEKIRRAEFNAFKEWSEQDIKTYIALSEKYAHCFLCEVEKLEADDGSN